jgi:hypothetical protein
MDLGRQHGGSVRVLGAAYLLCGGVGEEQQRDGGSHDAAVACQWPRICIAKFFWQGYGFDSYPRHFVRLEKIALPRPKKFCPFFN